MKLFIIFIFCLILVSTTTHAGIEMNMSSSPVGYRTFLEVKNYYMDYRFRKIRNTQDSVELLGIEQYLDKLSIAEQTGMPFAPILNDLWNEIENLKNTIIKERIRYLKADIHGLRLGHGSVLDMAKTYARILKGLSDFQEETREETIATLEDMTKDLMVWVEKVLTEDITREIWNDKYKAQAVLWESKFKEVIHRPGNGFTLELKDKVYQTLGIVLLGLSRGNKDMVWKDMNRLDYELSRMKNKVGSMVVSSSKVAR